MDNNYEQAIIWRSKAHDMHQSAGILLFGMKDFKNEIFKKLEICDYIGEIEHVCHPVYCMLLGLSFELLLKSINVLINRKIPMKHNLIELAESCNISLSKRERDLFSLLSKYIVWAGRYPGPKDEEDRDGFLEDFNNVMIQEEWTGNDLLLRYSGNIEWEMTEKIWKRIIVVFEERKDS